MTGYYRALIVTTKWSNDASVPVVHRFEDSKVCNGTVQQKYRGVAADQTCTI